MEEDILMVGGLFVVGWMGEEDEEGSGESRV